MSEQNKANLEVYVKLAVQEQSYEQRFLKNQDITSSLDTTTLNLATSYIQLWKYLMMLAWSG
jgi:hypothetical protein